MENKDNKENMEKVQELMATSDKIRLGGELKASVAIDYTSLAGTKYEGNIIFKRPTMLDYIKMGGLKSEYLREAGVTDIRLVDNTIKQMAQIMATLKTVVVKCPEWLVDLASVIEIDVLYHVNDKYEEWENSFRKSDTE